jgi:catechol 2,3-dioxygenase-like lactoylglutathione lyase family enzyme
VEFAWNFTKRIVADVERAERFYAAFGFKTVVRMEGGLDDEEVHQLQTYMSVTGDASSPQLILCRFVAFPPPKPSYPGESWLCFNVPDVDAACRTTEEFGGSIFRPGQDRPEHGVRAAVVADADGHYIELVGPMPGVQSTFQSDIPSRS